MSDVITIASEFIAVPSVSSQSNRPVADVTKHWMERLGFTIETIEFVDPQGLLQRNLIGRKGPGRGGLAYFGHNDVVPVDSWNFPSGPFEPTLRNDRLYGRGSCDMKGSVAAFLAAVAQVPSLELNSPVYFICTADEEIGHLGAQQVAKRSELYRELVAAGTPGIIGEPTSLNVVYAHKGGCSLKVVSHGRAAHSSTREGTNANWAMIPFLAEVRRLRDELLMDTNWHDLEFDPPDVRMNLTVTDHSPALNITAPESVCRIAFRPMPGQPFESILQRLRKAAAAHGLDCEVFTKEPALRTDPKSAFVQETLQIAGQSAARSVSYGTDGSSLPEVKSKVVLGPGDIAQAHTDDEWIAVEQLHAGVALYEKLIRRWCC